MKCSAFLLHRICAAALAAAATSTFAQGYPARPVKRRGNRRYYQHHEVLLIRRIRELLYEQGFTISGARNRLSELGQSARAEAANGHAQAAAEAAVQTMDAEGDAEVAEVPVPEVQEFSMSLMRRELISILGLLTV